jgi:fumagillin biosynthesis monooxygenase
MTASYHLIRSELFQRDSFLCIDHPIRLTAARKPSFEAVCASRMRQCKQEKPFVGVAPLKGKPPAPRPYDDPYFFKKDQITLPTVLLIGALAQALLFVFLPHYLALAPLAIFAFRKLILTTRDFPSPAHSHMRDVIPGRTSAQFPDHRTGIFSNKPSSQSLVVFHLGVRFNHTLGFLSPGAGTAATHFRQCMETINAPANAARYGLLGSSYWRAAERATQNTMMVVLYFRSVDGLKKFAEDKAHREAWEWLIKEAPGHVGFYHELFCVENGGWETVYIGMPPTLLGATGTMINSKEKEECVIEDDGRRAEEKQEQWVRNLVDANGVATLRSMFSRMGRGAQNNA